MAGYRTGGTLHIVINNQVGFTTEPHEGRSTTYATDVAKMLQIPIFHVNGEDPEAVAQVVSLAMDFRKEFHRDVVIDLYAFRRWGHNEGDEPRFTQPRMYAEIDRRAERARTVSGTACMELGKISPEEAEEIQQERTEKLESRIRSQQDTNRSFPIRKRLPRTGASTSVATNRAEITDTTYRRRKTFRACSTR